MSIFLQKPWKATEDRLYRAGRLEGTIPHNLANLESWLKGQRVHFGVVFETPDKIFAAVDRTRSFPIFYAVDNDNFYLADHPSHIIDKLHAPETNPYAIAIYMESGYCVGDQTFIKDVRQLISGQYLIWDKQEKSLSVRSYYDYTPKFPAIDKKRDYKDELGNILDKAIDRVIDQAAGREIWVPLSGGLDSRAVLGKLVERHGRNIQTFSYGSKGNTDCETARDIARILDVPWRYLEPSHAEQRKFFNSEEATQFLKQASRYSSGPTFTDFFALKTLYEQGKIGTHTLLVNGQSGDYLTGGHLPVFARSDSPESNLENFFVNKHFNLWDSLSQVRDGLCRDFIDSQKFEFSQIFKSDNEYLALYSFFNWLEWRERQSKYVISCQFNYDYFDSDWAIPLWDSDLMDFYEELPFEIFTAQKLYIDYLQSWNYKSLFSFIRRPVNPWPRNRFMALSLGRTAGLLAGAKAKQDVYNFMRYWSTQDVHYKLMPISAWCAIWQDIKNAEAFYALEAFARTGLSVEWPGDLDHCRLLLERHLKVKS